MSKLPLAEVLNSLDHQNKSYYDNIEDKKQFQPYTLMRFMSSGGNDEMLSKVSLMAVNTLVNTHFWDTEKDLQVALLYGIGFKTKVFHKWIPMDKKSGNAFYAFIYDIHAQNGTYLNDMELEIFTNGMELEDVKDLCREYGKTTDEEKKIVKSYRDL